jgi:hypothetical protein
MLPYVAATLGSYGGVKSPVFSGHTAPVPTCASSIWTVKDLAGDAAVSEVKASRKRPPGCFAKKRPGVENPKLKTRGFEAICRCFVFFWGGRDFCLGPTIMENIFLRIDSGKIWIKSTILKYN